MQNFKTYVLELCFDWKWNRKNARISKWTTEQFIFFN